MTRSKATSRPFSFATAVRMTIHELQQQGDMTTAMLVDEVISRYPDLVEQRKNAFVREAVAKEARRAMKATLEFIEGPEGQYSLQLEDLKLPNSLSIPPASGENDITWVPLETATYRQLQSNIRLLKNSVKSDEKRLHQMQDLETRLRPMMERDHADEPIKEWLYAITALRA